jgi:hypothetical protein
VFSHSDGPAGRSLTTTDGHETSLCSFSTFVGKIHHLALVDNNNPPLPIFSKQYLSSFHSSEVIFTNQETRD